MKSVPATDRGRASLERILDTACELFYVQGVRATGLDQIAKASKTGKGQIYHFFTGKTDLVLAVVERQTEHVLTAQQPYLSAMSTAGDLLGWADFLVRSHGADDAPIRCPLGALAAELTEDEPALRSALANAFSRWRDAIAQGLAGLARGGVLPADSDVTAHAELLLGAYQGGVLLSRVQGNTEPLRLLLQGAISQVLDRKEEHGLSPGLA
ncbi:TetR/AcrR family transcriptional regulator [Actinacidiphila bryophytorum]|nr:TetR/AcrR family transcriptional regulator [Actinacidiphila bryophytorum]MBM9434386.1 TetR/AcrR family transcriptional regulator [Actinacidiphila bryophytorum]